MSAINVTSDAFTCRQVEDYAVITIVEQAQLLSTSVGGREDLIKTLNAIKDSPQIKGLAVLYSDKYKGDADYKRYLQQSIEGKHDHIESNYATTYKSSLIKFFEIINSYPMPIVGCMDGDIGPDTFAINLAFDLRIATDGASFIHPNLQLGLPPSPPLVFFLVKSLGLHKAADLLLTKPKISSQDVLALGLITQLTTNEDLENSCLEKLRQLSAIPGHAIVETRRMIQPEISEFRDYIEAGFKGLMRSLYKLDP